MKSTEAGWSSPTPAEGAAGEPEAAAGKRQRSFLAELPVLVLIAFVLALVLKTFLVQAFYIPSKSMLPTLEVNDRVLVDKVSYRFREPRRGEVVVFANPEAEAVAERGGPVARLLRALGSGLGVAQPYEQDFIKRVIGLPGETIEMRDGVVLVDGEPLTEGLAGNGGYLAERDPTDFGPVRVPRGQYFVMGDNRRNSSDSRFGLGTIPREDILGRAFVVIWPPQRVSTLPGADYPDQGGARGPALAPAA